MNTPKTNGSGKLSGQTLFLAVSVVVSFSVLGYLLLADHGPAGGIRGQPPRAQVADPPLAADGAAEGAVSALRLADIPFDGSRAYGYLKQLCAIGPRRSGSPGMAAEQKLLAAHFQKFGGQVEFQRFHVPHPVDGSDTPLANLIVRWHTDRKERILFSAHYDTLPYPMRDPIDPRGVFVGANDGGSGIAVLMELARSIDDLPTRYGVDFVFFDAEEFIFSEEGRFFLGSEYFARDYVNNPPPFRYRWGVLLDMVGGNELQLYQEYNSLGWKDTRPLVEEIWATAARLVVKEFIPRGKHQVSDDHLALHNIAGIPTCDIIDFDYRPWHTRGDTVDNCSALSLAKTGWVLQEWLKGVR
ncbi:MAG: M28 family peptidase [Thermoguttaceae bacterium]|jgi:hypothetical protein